MPHLVLARVQLVLYGLGQQALGGSQPLVPHVFGLQHARKRCGGSVEGPFNQSNKAEEGQLKSG
jgi:hypothetical protein